MEKISVLVLTFNNEEFISRCLESVKWADEIVIIDSVSTDGTLSICRAYTDQILIQPFLGYAQQKNWGIAQCKHDWILQLDSDEELESGVEHEIKQALHSPNGEVDAYRFPRKNHVLGNWFRASGLYPDYQVRLFRKSAGQFKPRKVHERLIVTGEVKTLGRHILHYGMPNISKQLANLDRYTRYEADELRKLDRKFHWFDLVVRPILVFAYRYLWQGGAGIGYRGFVLAGYYAFYSFLTYAKLWEIEELGLQESP